MKIKKNKKKSCCCYRCRFSRIIGAEASCDYYNDTILSRTNILAIEKKLMKGGCKKRFKTAPGIFL